MERQVALQVEHKGGRHQERQVFLQQPNSGGEDEDRAVANRRADALPREEPQVRPTYTTLEQWKDFYAGVGPAWNNPDYSMEDIESLLHTSRQDSHQGRPTIRHESDAILQRQALKEAGDEAIQQIMLENNRELLRQYHEYALPPGAEGEAARKAQQHLLRETQRSVEVADKKTRQEIKTLCNPARKDSPTASDRSIIKAARDCLQDRELLPSEHLLRHAEHLQQRQQQLKNAAPQSGPSSSVWTSAPTRTNPS